MNVNRKYLNSLVKEISELTGIPYSKEQAVEENKSIYLYLEFASVYGGYRLVGVKVNGGGHKGVFGYSGTEKRLSLREMEVKLQALINGLKFKKI